ncbi:MAG TPA: efflux RND transporter periplasmic adaptor subunit [Gemmatimonadaceae bacterium]
MIAVAGVASIALAGCGKGQAGPPAAFPPPQVGTVAVAPRTVAIPFEFAGQVEPFRRVEVRARVDGIVEERPFTEGSLVTKGELLYRLDRVRYEAAYQGDLATYNNATRTLARLEPLLAKHAVAQQDVDNARTAVEASKAALDQAKKDLDDTDVRAEIAGRVGRAQVDLGARVTGSSDLLTTIDQLDPVYVTFHPSSQQLLQWSEDPRSRALLQPGSALAVHIVLPDGSIFPRAGRLNFIAPSLDSATGTQEFRAEFTNADRALVPGEFVQVRLNGLSRSDAIVVPQRAVQQGLGRQFVYVVGVGDTVATRDVKPGLWTGFEWVIDSGLTAGDRVIVDGVQKVGPGMKVTPVPASDSATAPSAAVPHRASAPTGKKP